MRPICVAAALCCIPLCASAQQVEPGRWNFVAKTTRVEGANLPPGIEKSLTDLPDRLREVCIDPEHAANGLTEIANLPNTDCSITVTSLANGVLEGERLCKGKDGANYPSHLRGRFSATEFTLENASSVMGRMTIVDLWRGRRLGRCE